VENEGRKVKKGRRGKKGGDNITNTIKKMIPCGIFSSCSTWAPRAVEFGSGLEQTIFEDI
jgi:hypothetical protein